MNSFPMPVPINKFRVSLLFDFHEGKRTAPLKIIPFWP
jgi:hypothetical protein